MEHKSLSIQYTLYNEIGELSQESQNLILQAKMASNKAYAPYSKFKVGVSLLLDNGKTIQANNQENAAFPSGLCAERVALFYKGANYSDSKITAMAIYAPKGDIVSPCGSCRQVMVESEIRNQEVIKLLLSSDSSKVIEFESFKDMLPLPFTDF